MRLPHRTTNIISAILFILSVLILGGTIYFLFNIKVLADWKLTLPDGDIHAGDTIVVQSTYKKQRDVSGEAVRYLECQNKNNVWVRYELNRATSDRSSGRGGTGLVLTMRRDVADVPTTCRVSVNIRYDVLPFKKVYVSNSTKEFTLLTEVTPESSLVLPQAARQKSLSQAALLNPVVVYSSYNTTVIPLTGQSVNSLTTRRAGN